MAIKRLTNGNDVYSDNNVGNSILGLLGNDTIHGNGGNDIIDGGAGADKMYGEAGNDTFIVDNAGDRVFELNGLGTDTVKSKVTFTLGSNVEILTLTGSAAVNGTGNSLGNVITGNAGANRLNGGGGNDTLDGGKGTDVYNGGAGTDTVSYASSATRAEVYLYDQSANKGEAAGDLFIGIESLTGTRFDDVLALDFNSTVGGKLAGGNGNDILNGSSGSDFIQGGAGNDTINPGSGFDFVQIIDGGSGSDKFFFTANYVGSSQINDFERGADTLHLFDYRAGYDWFQFGSQFFYSTGGNSLNQISQNAIGYVNVNNDGGLVFGVDYFIT